MVLFSNMASSRQPNKERTRMWTSRRKLALLTCDLVNVICIPEVCRKPSLIIGGNFESHLNCQRNKPVIVDTDKNYKYFKRTNINTRRPFTYIVFGISYSRNQTVYTFFLQSTNRILVKCCLRYLACLGTKHAEQCQQQQKCK